MRTQTRVALVWLVRLFLAALVVQFFFAGAGAFGATDWDLHSVFGLILVISSLVILIVAAIARQAVGLAGLLFVLMIVQMVLAQAGADASGWIAALHAVNALVVFGLAIRIVMQGGPDRVPVM